MTLQKKKRVGVYGVALRDASILLVHKGPNGIYRGLYDLPGGGIELEETPEQTLRREFFEEVGMSFDKMHLLDNFSYSWEGTIGDDSLIFNHLGHVYIVHGVQPSPYHYAQDQFNWYEYGKLQREQLTPFAWEVVHRLQSGKLAHVFKCC